MGKVVPQSHSDGVYGQILKNNEVATHLHGAWVMDVISTLKKYRISKTYVLNEHNWGYPTLEEHKQIEHYYTAVREWLLERKLLVHHVCRLFPSSTYHINGLLPVTPQLLLQLANDLVPNIDAYIPVPVWPSLMQNDNGTEVSICIKETLFDNVPSTQYIYGPESFYNVETYLGKNAPKEVSRAFYEARRDKVGTPAIVYGWLGKSSYVHCRDYWQPNVVPNPNPEPRDGILRVLTCAAVQHYCNGSLTDPSQETLRPHFIPVENIAAILLPDKIQDHERHSVSRNVGMT